MAQKTQRGRYVIQHHSARSDHYDFRLEINGVLKSWSVPKGPSLNPKEKRLAIPTPDHALNYAKKEGIIPQGKYGAGTVMVWDIGTFSNMKETSLASCYRQGALEVFIRGKKLHGAFALIRTKLGKKDNWLLIKMNDEHASSYKNIVDSEPRSALSDKTMNEIADSGKTIRC
jgi:bifunctional non-homologous end joining protein LigD